MLEQLTKRHARHSASASGSVLRSTEIERVSAAGDAPGEPLRITMALENCPYPQDVRVRSEATALVAAGHRVTVLAPRASGQTALETVDGVLVRRYRVPEGRTLSSTLLEYVVAMSQLHVRVVVELFRGTDVLHLHNPPDTLFLAGLLARLGGCKVVFDHHDLAPELFSVKFGNRWLAAVLRWCERATICVSHVVLSANESHRSVAIDRGHAAENRAIVVRNGPPGATLVDGPVTKPGPLVAPRLCYVGSLGEQDGVRLLPDIVRGVRDRGCSATLVVVGDGPERPAIVERARELRVADSVRCLGYVSHAEVPSLIREADVCLDCAPCNPLNNRSTMVKIGEYLAAARPTVSFSLLETQRTAGDAVLYASSGELEQYCDLVYALCTDDALRRHMSLLAWERARALTWEHSEMVLVAAYAGLVPRVAQRAA
jgi:glycosyltransferase involved in cell wall biosynthesis